MTKAQRLAQQIAALKAALRGVTAEQVSAAIQLNRAETERAALMHREHAEKVKGK